ADPHRAGRLARAVGLRARRCLVRREEGGRLPRHLAGGVEGTRGGRTVDGAARAAPGELHLHPSIHALGPPGRGPALTAIARVVERVADRLRLLLHQPGDVPPPLRRDHAAMTDTAGPLLHHAVTSWYTDHGRDLPWRA